MKKEVSLLLNKSLDSLILAIDHFNCPWDRGREEAVLILLDRSFELLLKAAILHRSGRIREKRAKETIGFEKCVRKCLTDESLKCLNEDQALTIQVMNSLRDAAQHYLLEISEQQLYMYSQAGVTLYKEILHSVFDQELSDHVPQRVLPVSSEPPSDLIALFDAEFSDIKKLVHPGSRKRLEARARVRSLAIVEASLHGERSQPSKGELDKALDQIQDGIDWNNIFPGVAGLRLDTKGTGLNVSIRLTKKKGEAVRLVPEGTPGATVVAVRKVNELGFYSMGITDIAKKLILSVPRALAVVYELNLQDDLEMFKEIKIGRVAYKRYSQKALEKMRAEISNMDLDEVWKRNNPSQRRR